MGNQLALLALVPDVIDLPTAFRRSPWQGALIGSPLLFLQIAAPLACTSPAAVRAQWPARFVAANDYFPQRRLTLNRPLKQSRSSALDLPLGSSLCMVM